MVCKNRYLTCPMTCPHIHSGAAHFLRHSSDNARTRRPQNQESIFDLSLDPGASSNVVGVPDPVGLAKSYAAVVTRTFGVAQNVFNHGFVLTTAKDQSDGGTVLKRIAFAAHYPLNPHLTFGFVPPALTHCSIARVSASVAERLPNATPISEP